MRKLLYVASSVIAVAVVLRLSVGGHAPAADSPTKPISAKELGKEWRYPGTGNESAKEGDQWVWEFTGPIDKPVKDLDRASLQFSQPKASFEEVWNFYAGKCGYGQKWSKDRFHLVIEKSGDGGQRIVADMTQGMRSDYGAQKETHFGLFSDKCGVHVENRKVDADHTAIRILTTAR
jgi:hypothetical protein